MKGKSGKNNQKDLMRPKAGSGNIGAGKGGSTYHMGADDHMGGSYKDSRDQKKAPLLGRGDSDMRMGGVEGQTAAQGTPPKETIIRGRVESMTKGGVDRGPGTDGRKGDPNARMGGVEVGGGKGGLVPRISG